MRTKVLMVDATDGSSCIYVRVSTTRTTFCVLLILFQLQTVFASDYIHGHIFLGRPFAAAPARQEVIETDLGTVTSLALSLTEVS